MIFVRDKGRMSNNILQYGHLYAWGREHHRRTVSMRFAYKYRYFNICRSRYHNFFVYLLAKYGCKWGIIPRVTFDVEGEDTARQEDEMCRHRLIVAEGWYARFPDLFIKYKEEIKRLFGFLPEVQRNVDSLYQLDRDDVLKLGVHIRRGDYATWQDGKYLYDDAQYISIIKQFIDLHPERPVEVYLCGNDPKMDRRVYEQALAGERVYVPQGNPSEDLYLLSRCSYLIGPPSTFSLVASMYRDIPLYWIENIQERLTEGAFQRFDTLFRHIR